MLTDMTENALKKTGELSVIKIGTYIAMLVSSNARTGRRTLLW